MNLKLSHIVLLVLIALLVAGAVNMGSQLIQDVQSSDGILAEHHARLGNI